MLYIRKLFNQDLRNGKQIAFPKEPSYSFFAFDYLAKEADRRISFVFKAEFGQFQDLDGRVITTRLYAAGSESRMDGEVKAFIRDELNAKVDDLLVFRNKGTKHTVFEFMLVPQGNTQYYPLLLKLSKGDNHSVFSFGESHQQEIPIDNPLQQIFYGAPGTGKSREVKVQTGERLESGKEVDLPNVFRTTFHPDTDYASFVGCYKPTMKPTSQEAKTLTGKDEEIVYEFVPQTFTDAYVYAYDHPTEQTYLVIEEINRGNCAQIFGDLFQLLDRKNGKSEYAIKADKDLARYLMFAKDKIGQDALGNKDGIKDGKLRLPENLNILATMNTSDQSLFPMDSAFKRRWEWKYIKIADAHKDWKIETGHDWYEFIKQINRIINNVTSSADKQLGYFFCQANEDGVITTETFVSKVVFYLWNDVFKDYVSDYASLFKYKTTEGDNGVEDDLTFPDFYDENGNVSEYVVKQFIEHVMAWGKDKKRDNNE